MTIDNYSSMEVDPLLREELILYNYNAGSGAFGRASNGTGRNNMAGEKSGGTEIKLVPRKGREYRKGNPELKKAARR